jgi:hypothetical protein
LTAGRLSRTATSAWCCAGPICRLTWLPRGAGWGTFRKADGKSFDSSLSEASVVSVHSAVPTVGWRVFVELPVAEAQAPLWGALIRVGCMLGLGLVAALLATVLAARRVTSVHPAPA